MPKDPAHSSPATRPAVRERADCVALDCADPFAAFRDRFALPAGVIYLDGNSLGALPKATEARIAQLVREEWGTGLIRSWNDHDWVELPRRVGDKLARLLGAREGEVIVGDSTSVNIFKLLAGALTLPGAAGRTRIVSERGNFPTDLYMIEGLAALLGGRYTIDLVEREALAAALGPDVAVALVTQVDYRGGALHDMRILNAAARAAGTRIVWDLSHSAGAVPVSLGADGSELAVGCGYKYLNGGPGAPAYLYVATALHAAFRQPLSGWFGHAAPFDFEPGYRPAAGIERMLAGTPSVIATAALECGVDILLETDVAALHDKSLALGDLFLALLDLHCPGHTFQVATPLARGLRGSQLALRHPDAYAIMQALIARGVIGDFRRPDFLRVGFAPLYLGYADIWDAAEILGEIMRGEAWRDARFSDRRKVT